MKSTYILTIHNLTLQSTSLHKMKANNDSTIATCLKIPALLINSNYFCRNN